MTLQKQFLDVVDRDHAESLFHNALDLTPLPSELIRLEQAWGRVLAEDIFSPVNVPSFDRSNYDGFAVQAADTYGATEEAPCKVQLDRETISTAVIPAMTIRQGQAVSISTGGMLPRGADSVVMIEHTDVETETQRLLIRRPVTSGFGVTFSGTDISAGELVLPRGQALTSRETGVLAAIGCAEILVCREPKVGIISTGDEVIPPEQEMQPSLVYDSNAQILADSIREVGGVPLRYGISSDNREPLKRTIATRSFRM